METTEFWIGLMKDASTGSWIWKESQMEANFTQWANTVVHPCVTTKAVQNVWVTHICEEKYGGTLCEMYDNTSLI